MALRPTGYRERLIDSVIDRMLAATGAVSVEGPKWCGKTWTALAHARSAFFVADPSGNYANRTLAQLSLDAALEGPIPRAIDEWREVPSLWDAVRFHVDQRAQPGQFLLTGSTTPSDDAVIHSGTGRIARIRMRPMTLVESGDSSGVVSLASILNGTPPQVVRSQLTLEDVAFLVTRGGWPASIGATPESVGDLAVDYLQSLARTDISQVDDRRRDPEKVMALLRSLARNTATTVGLATLRRDVAAQAGPELTTSTIADYLTLLRRLYVMEEIPAWHPALRSPVKLRRAPKRMLVDPSLAVAGMHASPDLLMRDPKTVGLLFETMMLRDLLVYAQHMRATLWHYRDDAGLEVDAIWTPPSGSWAAIEIKLGHAQVDNAARNLLRLAAKLGKNGDPIPGAMIVIVGVGGIAHQRADGVFVVPADLLGP